MSTTIDERVVSMQFNNKNFEQNVQTTMKSLDKLDKSLNLKGASKGLENVVSASKTASSGVTGVGSAVEAVSVKFSALQVMGVTALTRITNQAMATGERMLKALTIDPIKTGFQEYETQMNAVQTILANTQSKGSTLDDVNKALDTLNTYADKTIYNFTEMTRNIGTFTAAGVDLQTSVDSIQGIANLAAVSGSSSQQASTAMYQLSQALAAGRVSLMDWNSVVNAGMGGELFQNALIRTSELLKTGAKDAIAAHGSFRESLTKGEWLTTEVLTETLKQLSGAYTEAELMAQGFTKEQAKEITQLAKTATDAATKVKTFSQLWDVMKESAQSGWSQTWKIIVGDFEEAKALLTPLADFFTGIIGKMSDTRNKLLEGALGRTFTGLAEKLRKVTEPAQKAVSAVKDLGDIVDKVIVGSFGNGAERIEKLTKAGYNYYEVQNKVNEKLGNSFRYTEGLNESTEKTTKSTEKLAEATTKIDRAEATRLTRLAYLSDEQLKAEGYTQDQIKALRELRKECEKLGMPMTEFLMNLDKINGRTLVIDSLKRAGQGLVKIFSSIGKAYREIFPPMSADTLYNAIAAFHKFSYNFEVSGATAIKLQKTFKGLFAIIDIVTTLISGPLKIGFKILKQLLGAFDLDILDVTAAVGDAIVKFRDWLDGVLDFTAVFEKIAPSIKKGIQAIKDWINSLKKSDNLAADLGRGIGKAIGTIVNGVKDAFSALKDLIQNGFSGAGGDFVSGFVKGLKGGVGKVIDFILEFGSNCIAAIKEALDSHSPSRKAEQVGKDFTLGFFNGMVAFSYKVWNWIKEFGKTCVAKLADFFATVDFGTIVAGLMAGGMFKILSRVLGVMEGIASPFEALGDVLEASAKVVQSTTKVVKASAKVLKAFAMSIKAKALKDIAIAIGILALSLIALSFVPKDRLIQAGFAIGQIAIVMGLLMFALSKISGTNVKDPKDLLKANSAIWSIAAVLMSMALSFVLIAAAAKIVESIDPDKTTQVLIGMGAILGAMVGVVFAIGQLDKIKVNDEFLKRLGGMLLKVSIALLIMVGVMKIIAGMSGGDIIKGVAVIVAFGGIMTGMVAMTKLAGGGTALLKVGGTLIKMAIAIGLMVMVVKMIARLSPQEIIVGGAGLIAFGALMVGFISMTNLVTKRSASLGKLGSTLMLMAGSIFLLTLVTKMLGNTDTDKLAKGLVAVALLEGLIVGLIGALRIHKGQELTKVGSTLLLLSVSIGILAIVAVLLSLMSIKGLAKGIIAVGLLAGVMAGLIYITKFAGEAKKIKETLVALSVAIGVMAASVIALSFLDTEAIAKSTIALGLVMGMFAVMVSSAKRVEASWPKLIAMISAVALLAGLIILLSTIAPENALQSATALSMVMLALSASLASVNKMSSAKSLFGLLGLLGVVIAAAAVVGILWLMEGLDKAKEHATALSILMGVLSACTLAIAAVGLLAAGAFAGLISLLGLIIEMAAVVGILWLMEGLEGAKQNTEILTTLMTAMTAMLLTLAPIAPLALLASAAVLAMTGTLVLFGVLVTALGALLDACPKIEEFVDKGIPLMVKLAAGVGEMVGAFVAAFTDAIAESLPRFGQALSDFMKNAEYFIDKATGIGEDVVAGTKNLLAAVLCLTAADVIAGIGTFLSGGVSLSEFGTELSKFMENAEGFITGAQELKPEAMAGVKTLAEAIMILTAADLLNNLTSWLGGEVSLADFGAQLEPFGKAIDAFGTAVEGVDGASITAAAQAGKDLASMAKELPAEGGILQSIFGSNMDMETFGTKLVAFGECLADYAVSVTDMNVKAITASVDAAQGLVDIANKLPAEGGLKQSIFGSTMDMETFGNKLVSFGKSLVLYSAKAEDINLDALNNSVPAAQSLVDLANTLPEDSSVWSFLAGGTMDLETFGTDLVSFGQALTNYANEVQGLKTQTIANSVKAAQSLVDLATTLHSVEDDNIFNDIVDLSDFASDMISLGEGLKGYAQELEGVSLTKISNSAEAARKMATLLTYIGNKDYSGVDEFADGLGEIGDAGLTEFADAFANADTKVTEAINSLFKAVTTAIESKHDTLKSKGKSFALKFVAGIKEAKKSAETQGTSLANKVISAVKDKYDGFYAAGEYAVKGFVNGIKDNKYKAADAGTALGDAALEAAKAALEEHSPSKAFYQVGDYGGIGFTNALYDNVSNAYDAGYTMGDSATSGLRDTLTRIGSVLDSGVDINPVITPVLDLSDVRSGASAIGNLLNMGSSVGVLANVQAINRTMDRKLQNGGNDDVIRAIDRLGSGLSNQTGNTYNINGMSYSNDAELEAAFQTIMRYMVIEGRV